MKQIKRRALLYHEAVRLTPLKQTTPNKLGIRVLTSIHTAGKLGPRATLYSLASVSINSLTLLAMNVEYAYASALTGLAATLGGSLAAHIALSGGVQPEVAIITRLMLAMMLKWAFLITSLLLGFSILHLPALGLLSGLAIALFFQALAMTRQ
ncbi:MAG TPA: hypothetical protein ACQGQH_01755 [Xylella sp.]